jgi:hypothetical protein
LPDAVRSAADAHPDWPGSLKLAVRTAAGPADAAEVGPRLWRFVRRGGDAAENARAARLAEALHRQSPGDPLARRCLGYALYRTGQYEKALAAVGDAPGPDEEALRVLAHLALRRVPEASRAMASLSQTIRGTAWADGPLARVVADAAHRAALKAETDQTFGEWNDLLAAAAALLGDDLDHYSTAADLQARRGTILGRRGEALTERKEFAAAEAVLLESYRVTELAQAAHGAEVVLRIDEALAAAVDRLVRLYEATGRPEAAAKWRAVRAEPGRGRAGPRPTKP